MRHHLIVSVAVVMFYGCVPAPSIYYKPDSSVGRRVHIGSASIAPADGWEIESGKAKVRVQVTRKGIRVGVIVPPGSRAMFASANIQIMSNGREEIVTMKTLIYTEDKTRSLRTVSSIGVLEGGTISFTFGNDQPREYSTWLNFRKSLTDECEVHLPDLTVDGEIHSYDPVRFSKKLGAGIFFING